MKAGVKRGSAQSAEDKLGGPQRMLDTSFDRILVALTEEFNRRPEVEDLFAPVARALLDAIAPEFVAVAVSMDNDLHGLFFEARSGQVSPPTKLNLPLLPVLRNWMEAAEFTLVRRLEPGPAIGLPSALRRFQSLVAFPLRSQGDARGLILMGFENARSLCEEEIRLARTVTTITALFLSQRRSQRLQSSQELLAHLLKKIEVQREMGAPTGELLQHLAEAAQSLGGATSACLAEAQADSLALRAQAGEAPFASWLSTGRQCVAAPWSKTLRSGRRATASSSPHPPGEAWQEWMRLSGIEWLETLPLQYRGETLGIFLAAFGVKPIPCASDLGILRALASHASVLLGVERAEKRAIAAEASRRSLFEQVSEAALILDAAGACEDANPAAEQLFGRSASQLKGDLWRTCLVDEDRERVQEWASQVISGELAVPINARVTAKDRPGAAVELRLGTSLAGGRYYLMARDRTSEVSLKQESGRLRCQLGSLLDSLDCGILLCATDGRILLMNQRLAQVLGLDSAKLRGCLDRNQMLRHMREELFLRDDFLERWQRFGLDSEEVVWDQLEMTGPVQRSVERYGRPVYDEAGGLLGRLEVYRDIGGRALTEEKMLRADRMASLGLLISGIAHELNNPLTSVVGYSQLLFSRWTDPRLRNTLNLIQREAARAAHIVKNLLVFAREAKPERLPLDLNEVIRMTVALRSYKLDVENITVQLALAPRLPRVLGDRHQLQQVFLNLLLNAEQAIHRWRGRGTIRISTRKEGGSRVAAAVRDDGPGISPAIQPKIFDPFFTTKPLGEGTGLGLSIACGILHEHGGQINVKSEPGCGAEFTILLPVTDRLPVASCDVPERTMSHSGHARILVVEDEATVANLIVEMLSEEGHEAEAVLDSRVGLERIKREAYDLVICDLKMPGLDGRALYQELVNSGHPAQHHLLLITGDTLSQHTVAFLEASQLPHLAKPFRVEELKAKVHSLLGQERAKAGS